MTRKKIIIISVAVLLAVPAILDAIRYLKPDADNKKVVQSAGSYPISGANEMILVYNAWGGIYPGLADIVHKEFFSKTYPCNLCYQTFGTFGMKEEWKHFIDSLPLMITELHKDNFMRKYTPEDMQLPLILISNGNDVQVLFSAAELNQLKSLEETISATQSKLEGLSRR